MKNEWYKKAAAFIVTLLLSLTVYAGPVIHRAVEPAQMLLDITLKESSLTLYLTIPASASSLLVTNHEHKDIVNLLTETQDLWLPDTGAGCTLSSQRVFHSEHEAAEEMLGDIQGFYDFNCLNPQSLHSIRPNVLNTLPGLKQLNIWLTTDSWQNKQSLILPGDGKIAIKPGS
ncbi:ZrgA family zinc uptake protein [Endozoicomonas lisbonensis]|uniref:Uncharacterized protein n=1 Tax=Endozoicomonas lisbonensis TaxID=3120522 RepID=A0ABV2SC73_9GAMM